MTFLEGTARLDNFKFVPQSVNSYVDVLLDHDNIDECMAFLSGVDRECINPSTFLYVSRALARNTMWADIGKTYNSAHSVGCVSEELAFIAIQAVCQSELPGGKAVVLRKIIEDVSRLAGMKKNDWIADRYWRLKRYAGFHNARLLMRWNNPDTSQKEELQFAINEMRQCAKKGLVTKNDPLLCIVKIADIYGTAGRRVHGTLSTSQRRSAVNLILEACVEADRSGLMKRPAFTAEVVKSLRAMKANSECIQIVRALVSNKERSRHRNAMEEGIYASSEERDQESLQLFTRVFEQSGYDSRSLQL